MEPIAYTFVRCVLFVLFVTPDCLFLAAWGYCEERWHLADLTWAVWIFAFVYIVAAAWFANRTAHHYIFEQRNLHSSIRFAFYAAWHDPVARWLRFSTLGVLFLITALVVNLLFAS